MSESFAELFEQSLTDSQMQPGSIVMGTVMEIRNDVVVVKPNISIIQYGWCDRSCNAKSMGHTSNKQQQQQQQQQLE